MKSTDLALWLIAAASASCPAPALAAASTGPMAAHAPDADQTPKSTIAPMKVAQLSEVTVTGSRVITDSANSPTPITMVSAQMLQTVQPGTLADNLNDLPQFSGSRDQAGNPNPAGGNGAADELNLRNLGANRNLILLDGHRVPPTLTDGTVDIDMIPQMLVRRIDVVTGGASAVYGSDAISGVINFITDSHFDGLKVQAQRGISQYGDDPTTEAGVAAGTSFFGRKVHIEASYDYRDDAGILYRTDRPWDNQWAVEGAGTAADPYHLLSGVRLPHTAFGGLITSGALAGQTFLSNGGLGKFVHGAPSGSACCEIGGDGAYYDASMLAPLRMHQMFARLDFDLPAEIHAYLMGTGNIKRNIQYINAPSLINVTFSAHNAFLAPPYQAALAAANQTTFNMSELMSGNAPRQAPESDARQFLFVQGLGGDLGKYTWDLSLEEGLTRQQTLVHGNVNEAHLSAALDAVTDPATGQAVCNVSLTNPGLYPGCAPLDVFGPTAASAAAVNYAVGTTSYTDHTAMDDLEGDIKGAPFDTWAGPVDAALSFEWRRLTYDATSTATPDMVFNCTGLRYNCKAGEKLWQTTFAPRSEVSETVWEPALEFDAPLLKRLPFARGLDLNGAARYTSYSVSGKYWTWKIGLVWRVSEQLMFRATTSRDIRAPTLADLYAPTAVGTANNTDYLTGLSPQVPLITGGNPDLTAEIGRTSTAGLVLQPHWASGLSVSLDGFYIDITNAISSILGYNPLVQSACYTSGGSSQYCQLQTRPLGFTNTAAANVVTRWRNEEINISEIKTYGADLELNYSHELLEHPFAVRGFMTYQPHLEFNTPGLSTLDHAGVAFSTNSLYPAPVWAITGIVHLGLTRRLALDLMERWRSAYTMKDQPTQVWINPTVASFATTAFNLLYGMPAASGDLQVFLNVQNLFNVTPPPAAFYGSQTIPGQFGGWAIGDGPVGRYFTLGFRFRH